MGIKQVKITTEQILKIQMNNQERRRKKKSDFHANCRHSHSDFLDGGTQQKDDEHCCDSEEEEDRWIIWNLADQKRQWLLNSTYILRCHENIDSFSVIWTILMKSFFSTVF